MDSMAKDVGILAMDIYFPPACVKQVSFLKKNLSLSFLGGFFFVFFTRLILDLEISWQDCEGISREEVQKIYGYGLWASVHAACICCMSPEFGSFLFLINFIFNLIKIISASIFFF